jgi:trehalose utilization protein
MSERDQVRRAAARAAKRMADDACRDVDHSGKEKNGFQRLMETAGAVALRTFAEELKRESERTDGDTP